MCKKNEAADNTIFNIHEKMNFQSFRFLTHNCADIVKNFFSFFSINPF